MSTQVERARLLDALLEEMGEKGYEGAEVDAALERAGLDSNGFLVEFIDRDTSLRAAYEQLTGRLRDKATVACAAVEGDWPQQVCHGLRALLDELGRQPEPGPGPGPLIPLNRAQGGAQYQCFVEGLGPLLSGGREFSEAGEQLPAEVEMLAIGAAESIVYEEIEGGRIAELPALGPAILFSVLVPFLGPEAASAEMETAREALERSNLEVA